ncbi:MAG: hypothetical protein LBI19_09130, partial [Oscillospiraceae bacterium]|nr:hypothetical protein [Oscillospiraceae bacterium]
KPVDPAHAVEQAVFGVDMQVGKSAHERLPNNSFELTIIPKICVVKGICPKPVQRRICLQCQFIVRDLYRHIQ